MSKPISKPMPTSEQELMQRAEQLAGQTFATLAEQANITMPDDLTREKGWVGQLLEWHLGATAGSKPQPDFEHLGIELKTIPMGYSGRPLESTFVCVAPLTGVTGLTWQQSHVKQKLARVLWVPVEGERDIPLAQRRVGLPILWSPTTHQAQQLQLDWEEHMEWIALGKVEQINAKQGDVMQLRPKAANASVLTDAYNADGQPFKAQPKGFYLRTSFTENLLRQAIQARRFQ